MLSRRDFLRTTLLASGTAFAPRGLELLLGHIATGTRLAAEGFGPLVRDPKGLLDLPAGFTYRMFSSGVLDADRAIDGALQSQLTNGDPVPAQHDGMAAFAGPNGMTILVRNHEMNLADTPFVDPARRRPYDAKVGGGTTTLWVDRELNLVKSFASLSGTHRNCAGGATPWGSWLTAEEAVEIPGEADPVNRDMNDGVGKRHGYMFEVDAHAEDLVDPVPIVPMGRFRHEAVAVDPRTGFAYLSEDRPDGLLYRYRPDVAKARGKSPIALGVGDYAKGGTLEALRVVRRPSLKTQNWEAPPYVQIGQTLAIDWVRIPNLDPDMDEERDPLDPQPDPRKRSARTAATSTRAQGFSLGCAQFGRSEGIAFAHGAVYFCCTNGGRAKLGQVFRLEPHRNRLTLAVEPRDPTLVDGPDNLCPAPNGDLVVCEDNLARRDNHLVGITQSGRCYRFARNAHPRQREFAGATFSPDGRTLFVNVQQPGMTFAIRGPWEKRKD